MKQLHLSSKFMFYIEHSIIFLHKWSGGLGLQMTEIRLNKLCMFEIEIPGDQCEHYTILQQFRNKELAERSGKI